MPLEPVEGVVFGHLFTFLPPMRASQFSEQTAIDDRPELMPSPINCPAYLKLHNHTVSLYRCWLTTSAMPVNMKKSLSSLLFKVAKKAWQKPKQQQSIKIQNWFLPTSTVFCDLRTIEKWLRTTYICKLLGIDTYFCKNESYASIKK